MIAYIMGKVIEYGDEWILLLTTGGVGYQVFVTPTNLAYLNKENDLVALYTYLAVKEDGWSLYGFSQREEKEFFELLLKVSGIGPKVALSMLANLSLNQLSKAIKTEDLTLLTKIPGIGKKTAQRLVLELKEKVNTVNMTTEVDNNNQEVLDILLALGYSSLEANQALEKVLAQGEEKMRTEELVPLALKYLAR